MSMVIVVNLCVQSVVDGPFHPFRYFLAQYLLTRGLVHEVDGSDETADKKDE